MLSTTMFSLSVSFYFKAKVNVLKIKQNLPKNHPLVAKTQYLIELY